ncbi:unnamed protein product [Laminaria digitata]
MISCVDELENQRRELEARRAMLEERFKLRLATAQEFGLVHTRRLGRVREAFAAQCGVAQRRNQNLFERLQERNELFFGERASYNVSASRKRLSCQTERFLSVADKLYPAWQEEQLHRKATELRALEEERFTTEHRRKAARDIFEQEKALKEAVAGRRRQLAAAKTHERNELTLRRAQRKIISARDEKSFLSVVEAANDTARAARRDALAGALHQQRYSEEHDRDDNGGYGDGCYYSQTGVGIDGDAFMEESNVYADGGSNRGWSDKGVMGTAERFPSGRDERLNKRVAARERGRRVEPLLQQRCAQPEANHVARLQKRGRREEKRNAPAGSSRSHGSSSSTRNGVDPSPEEHVACASKSSAQERRDRSDKNPRESPPRSVAPPTRDRGDALHVAERTSKSQLELDLPRPPPTAASLGRNKLGGSFSSSQRSEDSFDQVESPVNNIRGGERKEEEKSGALVGLGRVSGGGGGHREATSTKPAGKITANFLRMLGAEEIGQAPTRKSDSLTTLSLA